MYNECLRKQKFVSFVIEKQKSVDITVKRVNDLKFFLIIGFIFCN